MQSYIVGDVILDAIISIIPPLLYATLCCLLWQLKTLHIAINNIARRQIFM